MSNDNDVLEPNSQEEYGSVDIVDLLEIANSKVFDDEEDKEYFEDFAKGLKGTQLKIKKANQGWYKNNIYDPDYTGE